MKDLDIVLFGATGFTGRLVAEVLVAHAGGARWAVAGRNPAKLEALVAELGSSVPILTCDASDRQGLSRIVERTKVVCSTVGPYALHGTPLVEACVEGGIGYCDLTGESHWIREMIDRFHARAVDTGARIVHCCGFDSVPSDLGVLMVADRMQEEHRRRLSRVRARVKQAEGRVSGGTIASALGIVEASRDPAVRRIVLDPYSLDPTGGRRGADSTEALLPHRDADRGRWTAPFPMSYVNARVVRRSNALLEYRYGESFRYDEAIDTGRGLRGWSRALAISLAMGGFTAAAVTPGVRGLLKRFLPRPGEGPSRDERERGRFRFELIAESEGTPPLTLVGVVAGEGDPGYAATSRMLSESALSLALDGVHARGVLTPAVAMGSALIERLRRAGMTFEVAEGVASR